MGLTDSVGLLFTIKAQNDTKKTFDDVSKDVKKLEKDVESTGASGSSSFSKIAGSASIAAASIAAVAGIAAGVASTFFNLAKSASDFGSEIFDASQKTGLSAEALSSLKVAADQSGSSLEQVTQSVSKFSRLIGEAAEGSEKAKETLIRLGLDPQTAINDLDGSLAIVFKRIADATNPIIATKLATEAFGRAGADIIPVIKSFDGDMAGLIKRCKELGLTINDEAAAKADAFGDQMDTVGTQVKHVGYDIGFALIPQIQELGKTFSNFLINNKPLLTSWAENTIKFIGNVVNSIDKAIKGYRLLGAVLKDTYNLDSNFTNTNQLGDQFNKEAEEQRQRDANNANLPKTTTGGGLGDAAAQKELQDALNKRLAAFRENNKLQTESLQQTYEASQKAWQDSLDRADLSFADYKKNLLDNIEEFARVSRILLEQAFQIDSQGKTGLDLDNAALAYKNALTKFEAEITKQKEEINKKQTEAEKKAADESLKIAQDKANRQLERDKKSSELTLAQLKDRFEKGEILEFAYIKAVADQKKKALDLELTDLEQLLKKTKEGSQERIALEQKIALLKKDIAINTLEYDKAIIESEKLKRAEIHKTTEALEAQARSVKAAAHTGENAPEDEGAGGTDGGGGFLDILIKGIGGIFGEDSREQITNGADYIKGVYADLAGFAKEAVGSMVSGLANLVVQWAITGKFSAKAALQMAAGVAAGIAVQAGIKALFELAEGYAALGNPFLAWTAPFHFAAAKMYGVVAGVSLGAAVGLGALSRIGAEKNSGQAAFSNQVGAATGRTGNTGQVYSQYGDDVSVVNAGRNTPSYANRVNQMVVTLKVRSNDSHIVDVIHDNVGNNGKLRNLIIDTQS